MDLIDNASQVFQGLIRTGVTFRVAYCFIKIGINEDESTLYKKRLKNAIIFLIISELIYVIRDVAIYYYG